MGLCKTSEKNLKGILDRTRIQPTEHLKIQAIFNALSLPMFPKAQDSLKLLTLLKSFSQRTGNFVEHVAKNKMQFTPFVCITGSTNKPSHTNDIGDFKISIAGQRTPGFSKVARIYSLHISQEEIFLHKPGI